MSRKEEVFMRDVLYTLVSGGSDLRFLSFNVR